MRNGLTGSILTIVAILAFSAGLLGQTAGQSGGAKAKPDLSGIWDGGGGGRAAGPGVFTGGAPDARGGVPAAGFTKEEPSMRPLALQIYQSRREGRNPLQRGREEGDPSMYPYCMPRGFPRVYNFNPFVEIVQTPNVMYMLFESDHQTRRIYLDGRKHLEGWSPSLMGISHGRWNGETLVVETENLFSLNNQAWLDAIGHPFTAALRVTERIRRLAHDTLQIDFTFDDPGAYTKPWTGKKVFQLATDWDMTDSMYCEDHVQEDFLRDLRNGKPAGRP